VNNRVRRCPSCGRQYPANEANPHRPFCSERCQLIDLGDWLTEKHRIKGEELPTEFSSDEDETP
jgi:hypothetical protein